MARTTTISLLAGALVCAALGAWARGASALRVGEPPPVWRVDTVLQAPKSVTLPASLQGRATVVELWATWCGPCVDAIPHVNALQEAAGDLPVTFVWVSDEPEATVKEFLVHHPMRGVVGLSKDNALALAWGVDTIPTTVLLDAQGRVAAVLEPFQLDLTVLRQLVAGEVVVPSAPVETPDDALVRLLVWRAAPDDDEEVDVSPGRVELRSQPLEALVAYAWKVPAWAVEVDPAQRGTLFHLSGRLTGDDEGLRALVRQALPGALGARISVRQEKRGVVVLRKRPPGGVPGGVPGAPGPQARSLSFRPAPMAAVVETVQEALKTPVVDETGLGLVEITFHDLQRTQRVEHDLLAYLGVVTQRATRTVTVVKVTAVKKTAR